MATKEVRATCRIELEREVIVWMDDDEDEIGEAEVLDAVYASGEFLDAIDVQVYDYKILGDAS